MGDEIVDLDHVLDALGFRRGNDDIQALGYESCGMAGYGADHSRFAGLPGPVNYLSP